jgi:hypothetical protein
VITGYGLKKKEATDAINAEKLKYSYAPEYSDFRKQVGAVIASLRVSAGTPKMSSKCD